MITVRYFAAAAEAAGRDEERLEAPATAADLRADLAGRHGADLRRVLTRCSLLADGHRLDDGSAVPPGATVDVLPPFAGG
ncbi:MoaD/ThiS family protein [Cellulomonas marina]|uniref:Molybdopterin converting factor, small subunit n=1 Tax=Cellulomonas marina TaxID=988821 RepID=A0A1I1AGU6_9CELL|nr:MoaD/ThiS family protein [Cellulomonas marina]GIG29735.1 putative molybdenum cofactor biosynthesis protein D2 (MoaD2) / thiamineS [Cellulomonas marina]SFB35720.1 Molybdopterin converting factor, small subunit [Cellulomonas marina]